MRRSLFLSATAFLMPIALAQAAHAAPELIYDEYGSIGPGVSFDLTIPSYPALQIFTITNGLPDGFKLIKSYAFDELFSYTKTWTDVLGHTATETNADPLTDFSILSHLGEGTPPSLKGIPNIPDNDNSWSSITWWDNNFDFCQTKTPKVGKVCSIKYEAWVNSSYYPIVTDPYNTDYNGPSIAQFHYQLFKLDSVPEPSVYSLLILGVGCVGIAIRRRNAVSHCHLR